MGFPDPVRRVRGRLGCRFCMGGISEAYWRTLSTVINRDVGLRGVGGLCGRGSCTYSISQYPFLSRFAHENFPTKIVGPFFAAVEPMCAMAAAVSICWRCLGSVAGPLAGLRHN